MCVLGVSAAEDTAMQYCYPEQLHNTPLDNAGVVRMGEWRLATRPFKRQRTNIIRQEGNWRAAEAKCIHTL